MSYEISYNYDPCGVITRFFGTVTDENLHKSCIDRIKSAELLEKCSYMLDDYSEIKDSLITVDCVHDVATFALEISAVNRKIKFFVVTPSAHLTNLARFWKLLSHDTGWEIHIFQSRKEAEEWINSYIR